MVSFIRTSKVKLLFAALVILAAGVIFVQVARAQEGELFPTDNDVNAIAKQLYCPVCPNTPLDVCETKACEDWRAQIKDQLASGWSEGQIINYFVEQYGERVLAEPRRPGFNSLVWMLPVLVVLLGLAFVWQVLKSWQKGSRQPVSSNPVEKNIAPEILAKIEKEIQELD